MEQGCSLVPQQHNLHVSVEKGLDNPHFFSRPYSIPVLQQLGHLFRALCITVETCLTPQMCLTMYLKKCVTVPLLHGGGKGVFPSLGLLQLGFDVANEYHKLDPTLLRSLPSATSSSLGTQTWLHFS